MTGKRPPNANEFRGQRYGHFKLKREAVIEFLNRFRTRQKFSDEDLKESKTARKSARHRAETLMMLREMGLSALMHSIFLVDDIYKYNEKQPLIKARPPRNVRREQGGEMTASTQGSAGYILKNRRRVYYRGKTLKHAKRGA